MAIKIDYKYINSKADVYHEIFKFDNFTLIQIGDYVRNGKGSVKFLDSNYYILDESDDTIYKLTEDEVTTLMGQYIDYKNNKISHDLFKEVLDEYMYFD